MNNLLEVRNLSKKFTSSGGPFRKARAMHAVNDVTFDLPKGRVIGVVGESGCGKSTLARLILRLIEPSGGSLRFDGDDLRAKSPAEMRKLRADMQMVFQDPYSAIDPRYTVARASDGTVCSPRPRAQWCGGVTRLRRFCPWSA